MNLITGFSATDDVSLNGSPTVSPTPIGYFDEALDKVLDLASLKRANVVTYTFFPNRKTNIYAIANSQSNPFDSATLYEKIIPSLKPGFYYLWLPKTTR